MYLYDVIKKSLDHGKFYFLQAGHGAFQLAEARAFAKLSITLGSTKHLLVAWQQL